MQNAHEDQQQNDKKRRAAILFDTAEDYYYGRTQHGKDYSEARSLYEQTIALDPKHANAIYSLGWLYEHDQGLRVMRDGVLLKLWNGNRYRYLPLDDNARYGYSHDRISIALEYYNAAAKQGHYESIKRYFFLANAEQKDAAVWFRWGKEYDADNNYVFARACFERVIQIYPQHQLAYQYIGMMYECGLGVTQDFDQARHYYIKYYDLSHDKSELARLERKRVSQILSAQQSIDTKDKFGDAALHRAAKSGLLKHFARLKILNADMTVKNKDNKTPGNYLTEAQHDHVNALQNKLTIFYNNYNTSAPVIMAQKVSVRSGERNSNEVCRAFSRLFEIPELEPLFKLAKMACLGKHRLSGLQKFADLAKVDESDTEADVNESQQLQIMLDATQISVHCLIGYGRDGLSGQNAVGLHAPKQGNIIYIGTGNRSAREIKATIFHELCHFIATEVFANGYRPYAENDLENKNRFGLIVEAMRHRRASLPDILSGAFADYYQQNDQVHGEIIVRCAQYIVMNFDRPEFRSLREIEPELYQYYNEVFLEKVKSHTQRLEQIAFDQWQPSFFRAHQAVQLNTQVNVGNGYRP